MTTTTAAAPPLSNSARADQEPYHLQCMEVWSGNQRIDNAVAVAGIDAWVHSEPYEGDAQGGDIHYVSVCGAGKISRFAVADVSGHGAVAGDLATRLRKLMRKYINTLDQTRFARALNSEFGQLAEQSRFATALLTSYFAPTDHLVVCNAGHPRPLWYRARSQTWELLDQRLPQCAQRVVNLPLGIIEPTDYAQFAVQLDAGDLVLLYTDSITEAENGENEQLGEQGLLDLVRGLAIDNPAMFNRRLLDALAKYTGNRPVEDDLTLLLLHHNAEDPPRQSFREKVRVMGKMFGLIGD